MLLKTLLIPLILGLGLVEAAEIHPHHQERRGSFDFLHIGPGEQVKRMADQKPEGMGTNSARLCHPGKYTLWNTDDPAMFFKTNNNHLLSDWKEFDCMFVASTNELEQRFEGKSHKGFFRAELDVGSNCTINRPNATVHCPISQDEEDEEDEEDEKEKKNKKGKKGKKGKKSKKSKKFKKH